MMQNSPYAPGLIERPANPLLVRRSVSFARRRQTRYVNLRSALYPVRYKLPADHCVDTPGETWRAYAPIRGRAAGFARVEQPRLQDPLPALLERVQVARSGSIRGRVPVR